MFKFIKDKIFGNQNEKELKRLAPLVTEIEAFEKTIKSLSDEQLRAKTDDFRLKVKKHIEKNSNSDSSEENKQKLEKEALGEILPEAFAVCREAAWRTLCMRHFDVQIIGGIILHEGKIAEMTTGEGKTLAATLAVYLNALMGKGVHVVTVNDYLAQRDCGWMGPVYSFLGLTCASITHDFSVTYDSKHLDAAARDDRMAHLRTVSRKEAYGCDVTYGTNNEFGFDYLRSNMVMHKDEMVQRELNFAIVDEVDSILIDEARTPLIISGPAEVSTDKYYKIDKIIPKLTAGEKNEETKEESGDFIVEEKANTVYLTDEGEVKVSKMLGVDNLSSLETMELKHHVDQALKAHSPLFRRDVHYVVKDGQVIIVDDFTGRLMPGRRWSDGLHQAIEAKEGMKIERENQTLATITFQNYFRMYSKLSGMTGTALTEEAEFQHIYKLDVVVIPTNRSLIRKNDPDVIYKTAKEKFKAVVEEIIEINAAGRPVLVGTISIENSELISRMLKSRGIAHNVLNAKSHEQEAPIIAQAGKKGFVTIATNMAGRGTDILLGGNAEYFANELLSKKGIDPQMATKEQREKALKSVKEESAKEHSEVVNLSGLHIIGTERHEARRIDNQLRGRAGRQGDPGSSRFYLSLEDDLMRIFASDRITKFMNFVQWEEDMPIDHPMIGKSIEIAQKRVEGHNFDIRKQLLKFGDILSKQRNIVYDQRQFLLNQDEIRTYVLDLIDEVVVDAEEQYMPEKTHPADWNISGMEDWLRAKFGILFSIPSEGEIPEMVKEAIISRYDQKITALEHLLRHDFVRSICLHVLDTQWKDHLYAMDTLREGIGLRAFGQKDPLVEYQHEGYVLFSDMLNRIKEETLEFLFKVTMVGQKEPTAVFEDTPVSYSHPQTSQFSKTAATSPQPQAMPPQFPGVSPQAALPKEKPLPFVRNDQKVGRNDPCTCGSGKKFKKCCGKSQ
ncbi:MAG: preprotein translocase subunit SecA [Candidatus Omnitrophica bacterium]|nr:preprotein translocase subunit SecA [Candidatus Omnitrophota bacterium]